MAAASVWPKCGHNLGDSERPFSGIGNMATKAQGWGAHRPLKNDNAVYVKVRFWADSERSGYWIVQVTAPVVNRVTIRRHILIGYNGDVYFYAPFSVRSLEFGKGTTAQRSECRCFTSIAPKVTERLVLGRSDNY